MQLHAAGPKETDFLQRRVHSGTIHSRARSEVGLVHYTPLEVVDWELDWISDGVECSYPTPGQLLFQKFRIPQNISQVTFASHTFDNEVKDFT